MLHRLKALAPCFRKSTAHVICLDLVLSKEVCLYGDADWLWSPVSQWWEVSCATSLFTNRLPSVPYLYYWFYSAGQVCLTPYLFLPSQCLLTTNSVYSHQQFFCGLHHCVSSNHKLSVQTSAVFPSSLLLSVSSNLKLSVQTSAFLFLVIIFVLHIIVEEKLCLHTIKTQYKIHQTIVLSLKLCLRGFSSWKHKQLCCMWMVYICLPYE